MLGLFTQERDLVVAAPAAPWGTMIGVEERYRPLVERLERSAAANPASYRRRVLLGGALGYSVVLGLAFTMGGLAAGLIYFMFTSGHANFLEIKLLLVLSLVAWGIFRSLWVRTEPPEGRRIELSDAPALFSLIERLRSTIGGPRIHEVLISREFNASIVQRPRLGIFGWYRNYLVIGLPLLQGLTEDEAAAVIAHELGHFAGEHGRLASSIYRVRMTWAQLSEHLQDGHSANLLRRFFAWYGPWFNAYSFALARLDEYEADRAAASATSPATAASALVRITTQGERVDRHWTSLWEEAAVSPQPARFPFSSFAGLLCSEAPPQDGERSLASALAMRTSLDDTHPCLAERLGALGVAPAIPPAVATSAAEKLLGPFAETLAAEFDESWWAEASGWWGDANRERRQQEAELTALDDAVQSRELSRDERVRLAELTALIRGEAAALPLYEAMLAEDPEDGRAAFMTGVTRLNLDDASGVSILEELAERQPLYASAAYEMLGGYHLRRGDAEAAKSARQRFIHAVGADEEADSEFRALGPSSAIEPPPFDQDQLAELKRTFDGIPGLKRLYLGCRTLKHGNRTQLILLVEPTLSGNGADVVEAAGELLLPWGDYIAFSLARDTRWLRDKLARLPGAQILP